MQVLFLDFDGVLNTTSYFNEQFSKLKAEQSIHSPRDAKDWSVYLIPEKIELLNRLFDDLPEVKIIIHSNWGIGKTASLLKKCLVDAGFKHIDKVLGTTPKKFSSSKVHEIMFSLGDCKEDYGETISRYLIIDDDDVGYDTIKRQYPMPSLMLRTESEEGLTLKHCDIIKTFFTKKFLFDSAPLFTYNEKLENILNKDLELHSKTTQGVWMHQGREAGQHHNVYNTRKNPVKGFTTLNMICSSYYKGHHAKGNVEDNMNFIANAHTMMPRYIEALAHALKELPAISHRRIQEFLETGEWNESNS